MRRLDRGFTLLELLFTVAIVALLATLAFPGYLQAMHRALRQEARLALLRVQHQQERHFSEHHVYSGSPAGGNRSDGGHYILSIQRAADGLGYVAIAQADPRGRQAADAACAFLSVDETGRRSSAAINGGWRENDAERCWG